MGGKTAKLADVTIRSAKPSSSLRKLADGRGLQLWITSQGMTTKSDMAEYHVDEP